jgi:YrbI family 3-deoxy-D-manno-octulosonate 8-phosphate phosphatase
MILDDRLREQMRRLRLMVFDFDGIFTDNSVYVFEDGREAVRCSRFDGIGLRRLERSGVTPVILSTETNPVVGARARKLQVPWRQGIEAKLAALDDLMTQHGVTFEETGYIGNDINDRPCLKRVGLAVVVADAHPDVFDLAHYATQRRGGEGAVREICDLIAEARGTPSAYME